MRRLPPVLTTPSSVLLAAQHRTRNVDSVNAVRSLATYGSRERDVPIQMDTITRSLQQLGAEFPNACDVPEMLAGLLEV